jgi:hypothetical protein
VGSRGGVVSVVGGVTGAFVGVTVEGDGVVALEEAEEGAAGAFVALEVLASPSNSGMTQ